MVRSLAVARHLGNPERAINEYGEAARLAFAQDGNREAIPVVICAKDEQKDLPAVLAGLALTKKVEVLPLVIDNGSTDHTSEYAKAMGATVITEPRPGKLGATQTGIREARERTNHDTVLFLDADTIPGTYWAVTMTKRLRAERERRNSDVSLTGAAIFAYGPSKPADVLRTTREFLANIERKTGGGKMAVRGYNYGLDVQRGGLFEQTLNQLPHYMLPAEDRAVLDAVSYAGGHNSMSMDPKLTVITRNDRVTSVRSVLQIHDAFDVAHYAEQYDGQGVFEPYTGRIEDYLGMPQPHIPAQRLPLSTELGIAPA